MAEGWIRQLAERAGVPIDVHSAGTEETLVKPEAVAVMAEADIDINHQRSKHLADLPDPWNFDIVITVCDAANEVCPVYPNTTTRLHIPFPDPSGQELVRWREVRDAIGRMAARLVEDVAVGVTLRAEELRNP
jgi:arsenate reductase